MWGFWEAQEETRKCEVGMRGRELSGRPSGPVWSTRYQARERALLSAVDREDVRGDKGGRRQGNRVNQCSARRRRGCGSVRGWAFQDSREKRTWGEWYGLMTRPKQHHEGPKAEKRGGERGGGKAPIKGDCARQCPVI